MRRNLKLHSEALCALETDELARVVGGPMTPRCGITIEPTDRIRELLTDTC